MRASSVGKVGKFGTSALVLSGGYSLAQDASDYRADRYRVCRYTPTTVSSKNADHPAAYANVSGPLSNQNFATYGASTTPTLVVLNRAGQVSLYHPGAMQYEDLRAAIEKAAK